MQKTILTFTLLLSLIIFPEVVNAGTMAKIRHSGYAWILFAVGGVYAINVIKDHIVDKNFGKTFLLWLFLAAFFIWAFVYTIVYY
jgi:hypothetical protein